MVLDENESKNFVGQSFNLRRMIINDSILPDHIQNICKTCSGLKLVNIYELHIFLSPPTRNDGHQTCWLFMMWQSMSRIKELLIVKVKFMNVSMFYGFTITCQQKSVNNVKTRKTTYNLVQKASWKDLNIEHANWFLILRK